MSILNPGNIYLYKYDARWKSILPKWDALPFCLVLENYSDGHLGLNLHYLNRKERIVVLKIVKAIVNMNRQRKKRKLSYTLVTKALSDEVVKVAIKRYLTRHIRNKPKLIDESHWINVANLPLERWRKYDK